MKRKGVYDLSENIYPCSKAEAVKELTKEKTEPKITKEDCKDEEEAQHEDSAMEPLDPPAENLYKVRDVKKLLTESKHRVTFNPPSTTSDGINKSFRQLYVDGDVLEFVQCNVALADLTLCGSIFKLPRHDKKHVALCRHLSSHSIDDKENKIKKVTDAGDWTPEHIQQIKSELKVPMQRSKKRRLEEKKAKTKGGRDIYIFKKLK